MNLFPFGSVREAQSEMVSLIENSLSQRKNLLIHAPTGIGKTAAALSPCLAYAIENKKTVFFLTARQTQHSMAIETLKEIKKSHDVDIKCADIIGKREMCLQQNAGKLTANEFREYCKTLVEEKNCKYHLAAKQKGNDLINSGPAHVNDVISICRQHGVCPYEVSVAMAEKASVIIADYFHIFHPAIRQYFMQRSRKSLGNCIIIVDEAHNLGRRCRDLMTFRLTSFMLERAIDEASRYAPDVKDNLEALKNAFEKLYLRIEENSSECLVLKSDFIKLIPDYDLFFSDLLARADDIRKLQQYSYIGSVGVFLEAWKGDDEGFARIFSAVEAKKGPQCSLVYRSLDPSTITSDVFSQAHATLLMSGTLTPTAFYRDILGVNAEEKEFTSPFPKSNRLNIIIPETTTKFTRRTQEEFQKIAEICAKIIASVPGNCAFFFPSYFIRDAVYTYVRGIAEKPIFREMQGLGKEAKEQLLAKFKKVKDDGGVLLGVSTGSFGEGIDLPGDLLKCVVIVGLPLEKPDLETRECVRYYQEKFGKGWEYGYIFPAITKCMQNAGRCIRSETDKGVIVFLDERYAWDNYLKCFPKEWDMQITSLYEGKIRHFFSR